jgi:hypothetical protein
MNRIDRLAIDEAFRQVAADCLQRRHPHAMWLVGKRPEDMNDTTITEAVRRLKSWLAEQPELPIHPDSWIAKRDA